MKHFVFDLSRNTPLKYYDNQIHRLSKRAYWLSLRTVPKIIAPLCEIQCIDKYTPGLIYTLEEHPDSIRR